jgi:hypothetical protein
MNSSNNSWEGFANGKPNSAFDTPRSAFPATRIGPTPTAPLYNYPNHQPAESSTTVVHKQHLHSPAGVSDVSQLESRLQLFQPPSPSLEYGFSLDPHLTAPLLSGTSQSTLTPSKPVRPGRRGVMKCCRCRKHKRGKKVSI